MGFTKVLKWETEFMNTYAADVDRLCSGVAIGIKHGR